MKKLFYTLAILGFFVSCEKGDDRPDCPVVKQDQVPAAAQANFSEKYSAASAVTWYNKDDKGYVAVFKSSAGEKVLAQYDNNGNFVKEDKPGHDRQECGKGEREDHHDEGCECDTEDDD